MIIEQPPLWFRTFFYPQAVWRMDRKIKNVYLTFDDGPVPEVTSWVLDILDKYNIKATFFCVGENVKKHPDLFKEIQERGHRIGNHTYHHMKGFNFSDDEYLKDIELANELIQSNLFRPPYGRIKPSQFNKLKNKYKIILWDLVTRDYNNKLSPEKILSFVKDKTRNGSIIVFHDSMKAKENLYSTLPASIEYLLDKGYQFKTL